MTYKIRVTVSGNARNEKYKVQELSTEIGLQDRTEKRWRNLFLWNTLEVNSVRIVFIPVKKSREQLMSLFQAMLMCRCFENLTPCTQLVKMLGNELINGGEK